MRREGWLPSGQGGYITPTHGQREKNMEAKDLLELKVGSLIKTAAHGVTGRNAEPVYGTITYFHAPKFISVLMHQGMFKNKIVFLRGYDFDCIELVHANSDTKQYNIKVTNQGE